MAVGELTRMQWHDLSAKCQLASTSAKSLMNSPGFQDLAIRHAQAVLNYLWKLGFRPSDGAASYERFSGVKEL